MNDRLQCPMFKNGKRCPGRLRKTGDEQTYLGIMNGVDDNRVVERFECETCGEEVVRSWHWDQQRRSER